MGSGKILPRALCTFSYLINPLSLPQCLSLRAMGNGWHTSTPRISMAAVPVKREEQWNSSGTILSVGRRYICWEPRQHITCFQRKMRNINILKPHREHSLRGDSRRQGHSLHASHSSSLAATVIWREDSLYCLSLFFCLCGIDEHKALGHEELSWQSERAREGRQKNMQTGWVIQEEPPGVTSSVLAQCGVIIVQQCGSSPQSHRASAQHKENA